MNITANYYRDITDFHRCSTFAQNNSINVYRDSNNFKGWYLSIEGFVTPEGDLEFPICISKKILFCLKNDIENENFNINNIKELDSPFKVGLFENTITEEVFTGNSAIRSLLKFPESGINNRLRIVKFKGHYYYGLPGIILDEEGIPLLISYTRLKAVKEGRLYKNGAFLLNNNTHYVHPKIFTDSKNLFYKALITKVIPNLMTYTPMLDITLECNIEFKPYKDQDIVQIADYAHIITKTKGPKSTEDVENIQDFLINNVDEVVSDIIYGP